MTRAARDAFLIDANEALSDPLILMGEGRPHKRAKSQALDMLGLHFKTLGRVVYLAEEMTVVYPGDEVFSPDVLAVVGVEQPDDDERLAWAVADEGRGLDLVLEVLHHGDRKKDLERNVERYARLGIPEYFVYDRAQQRVHGFRLPQGTRRYVRIVPQAGRYASVVLGLDLAVQGGTLRFFNGASELFGTETLIARLEGMVDSLEAKADAATARAEQEAARAQQEAARAQQEAARAEQEAARAQQEAARARRAVDSLRAAVLAAFDGRGIVCRDAQRDRVARCDDAETLQRWLMGALTAPTADDALG